VALAHVGLLRQRRRCIPFISVLFKDGYKEQRKPDAIFSCISGEVKCVVQSVVNKTFLFYMYRNNKFDTPDCSQFEDKIFRMRQTDTNISEELDDFVFTTKEDAA
jgi:hypothetical protein